MKKQIDLQITYRDPKELVPYVNNARTHSDEQVRQIAASIKEFGFNDPVELDGDRGIISGHGRVQAALLLGLDRIPTVDLHGLSEAQKKAYILAANKIALNADWDRDLLKLDLEYLKTMGGGIVDLTGFNESELDDIFEVAEDEENPYTDKIDVPQYEVKGTNPKLTQCLDTSKTDELIKDIESADITAEERDFLIKAAQRHTAFNYSAVAEYYANASKEMQRLMEQSALVIIDFDNAMREGFVRLSKELRAQAGVEDAS